MMHRLIALCVVVSGLTASEALAVQKGPTLPSPAMQVTLLSDAIKDDAIYIDKIHDSGVFSGYVESHDGIQYPAEVYLNGTISLCLEKPKNAEFRVCLAHTLLEKIEGDEEYMDPAHLTRREVVYANSSGRAVVISASLHYFEYEDLIDFNSVGSFSDAEKELAQRVIKNSVAKSDKALGSFDNIEHPKVPSDLIHITLVEEVGPYQFTALLKSKAFPAKLTTVYAERIDTDDTFKVTFIDKEGLPELYGHSYQYRPKFYGKPFSGKPVFEICRFDGDDVQQDCGEYWLDLSKYFQDEAERDIFYYM